MDTIIKTVTNAEGIERELKIFPLQIMGFFDVLIFNTQTLEIIKQTKKGDFVTIDLVDSVNENTLEDKNVQLVFDSLKEFIVSYGKENNMRVFSTDNDLTYVVDLTFLNNIISIDTDSGFVVTTEHGIAVKYESFSALQEYITEFVSNKYLEKQAKFNDFMSKESSVLKRELEIVSGERERDRLSYNLKNLELEKEFTDKLQESQNSFSKELESVKDELAEEKSEVVRFAEESRLLNARNTSLESELEKSKQEIKDITAEKDAIKNKSKLPIIISSLIIGIGIGVFGVVKFDIAKDIEGLIPSSQTVEQSQVTQEMPIESVIELPQIEVTADRIYDDNASESNSSTPTISHSSDSNSSN